MTRRFLRWPFPALMLIAAALSGCATRGGDIAYNPTDFTAPDALPPASTMANYRLSAGDVVTVHVFELDTLSGDQEIDETGHIDMPLLGPVDADGDTTQQLSQKLTTLLQAKYLQSPHVTVVLKAAVPRTITVSGGVRMPGVYQIDPSSTTLLEAVALAHGLGTDANPRRVVIFRQINGTRKAAAFDLTSIGHGKDPDPAVYPRDTVVVDGSGLSDAYRNVLRAIPLAGLFLGL